MELAHAPNRFLSAVQIGITVVGILAGAFGGRTIADRLAAYLSAIPVVEPYSQAVSLAIVVLGITYFSLVIGELVPKRLALGHPEEIATIVAVPLRALSTIASPVVRLLSISTDALFHLLARPPVQEPPVREEEIKTLVQQGTEADVFEESWRTPRLADFLSSAMTTNWPLVPLTPGKVTT